MHFVELFSWTASCTSPPEGTMKKKRRGNFSGNLHDFCRKFYFFAQRPVALTRIPNAFFRSFAAHRKFFCRRREKMFSRLCRSLEGVKISVWFSILDFENREFCVMRHLRHMSARHLSTGPLFFRYFRLFLLFSGNHKFW